jgi:hypothetical protein
MPREERAPPRPLLSEKPWDEERERIVERQWYERRTPTRPSLPPPPPPPPAPKVVEKEKVVIIR